ncbi:MAG TPA: Hint domain-containing protein, partial [Acidimicrobiales bacterium]|nr:Hint domain-containing protein [Acidimicrobiales bacterium]
MATAVDEAIGGQVAAYQRAVAAVRLVILAFVARAWDGLEQYRDEDIERWVAAVTPVVGGGLVQVAAMTDAHLANVIGLMLDEPPRPIGVRPDDVSVEALRGVPAAEVYRRAGETVWSELARGVDVADAVGQGLDRAQRLAATDLQLAKTHTARRALSADKRVTGWRRVLNGTSCKLCVVASTRVYRTDQLQPGHVRCVIGSTRVASASAREVTRRWHEGEVVVLRTASGNEVTITSEHPVLTTQGWVPAGQVHEGMDLLRSADRERVGGGVPDEHDVPASIEERFRAGMVRGLVSVPFSSENFHGDIGNGDVDVVLVDGLLPDGMEFEGGEPSEQELLAGRGSGRVGLTGLCPAHQMIVGLGDAADGVMGGLGLGLALLGREPAGAVQAGGLPTTDRHSSLLQVASDNGTIGSKALSQDELGLPGQVAIDYLWGEVDDASVPNLDPPSAEFPAQSVVGNAGGGRRLVDALAGQVVPDRCLFVGRVNLSAHVYNLHT